MLRILVVDDEPLARRRLLRLLEEQPDCRAVGEAGDGDAAIALNAANRPDVVFLDMQMPGRDGLEVALSLAADESPPILVFITAYDNFAVQAFDLGAVDYLLKPFDDLRFAAMLDRVRQRLGRGNAGRPSAVEHLVAISAGRVRLLPVPQIERIDSAGNYASVKMMDGGEHLVRDTLTALADALPEPPFVRVHRSTIIRTDRIVELQSSGHGDARLVLAGGDCAPVSRRYRQSIARLLPRG